MPRFFLALLSALPIRDSLANVADSKPNVLFIFNDDQRADSISALGNSVIKTPNWRYRNGTT